MIYIATKKNGTDYLIHHGIKGQKWGVRRYQNEDGSLKPAGEKRYSNADILKARSIRDKYAEGLQNISNKTFESEEEARYKVWDKSENYDKYDDKYSEEFDKVFKKSKEYKDVIKQEEKMRQDLDKILDGHTYSDIRKIAYLETGKEKAAKVLKTVGYATAAGTIAGLGIWGLVSKYNG